MPTFKKEKQQKRASSPNSTVQAASKNGAAPKKIKKKATPETGSAKPTGSMTASAKATTTCKVMNKCGGCSLLAIPYEEQLERKQEHLKTLLKGLCTPDPIIGAKHPLHYRNKVNAAFDTDRNGRVILGLYEENSHRVIENTGCLIEDDRAAGILNSICKLVNSFKLQVYNPRNGRGLLKHVQLRFGAASGEIMVILVCSGPVFPSKNAFVKELLKSWPGITTIIQNINAKETTMVIGERNITLYGPGFIVDELCGNRFRISPGSFYQINHEQTELLYGKAMEFAALRADSKVLDAYCGTGTIALTAARVSKHVTGVELNKTAVRDAIANARANGLADTRFVAMDAGAYMDELASQAEGASPVDVVFMDPPRSGSTPKFIESCVRLAPKRIVYISCEPVTLARDLRLFKKLGYKVSRAVGVDMFPQTENVESIALLQRMSNTRLKEITLDVDMEDYHRIKRESGEAYL